MRLKSGKGLLKAFLFAIVFTIVFIRWWNVSIYDEGYARSWFYGDSFSSKNVMSTVMFYSDSGFDARYAYLPVLFYKHPTRSILVYTHYPGLPDLIATIISQVTGTVSARKLMLFPLALSMALFFLIFKVLDVLLQEKNAAFLGSVFLVSSNYFICWADDLHQHVYVELVRWLFVWLAYRFFSGPQFNSKKFIGLCVLYFLAVWLSFEPVVFFAIVSIGFSIIFRKKVFSFPLLVLLTMPVLGFALHMVQNYYYFGSWQAVYNDITQSALHRTLGKVGYNELGREITWSDVPFAAKLIFLRIGKFYWLSGPVLLLLLIMIKREGYSFHFKLILLFMAAALSWHFVMPQHAIVHMFTIRHYAIPLGMIAGIGLLIYAEHLKQLWQKKSPWLFLFHFPMVTLSAAYSAYEQVYLSVLKYSVMYPKWGDELKFVFWN